MYTDIGNGHIGRYDLISGQENTFYVSSDDNINVVKTNSNGDILVGGGTVTKPGFLKLYTKDLKLKQVFADIEEPINDVLFNTDESFSTVDDGGKLIFWNTADMKRKHSSQSSIGISMRVKTSSKAGYFLTDGMIANELNLMDKSGNKIQSLQTETITDNFVAVDENCYAYVNNKILYYYYTPMGFMKSGRIASLEKLQNLEKEIDPFSIHNNLRKALMLDHKLQ